MTYIVWGAAGACRQKPNCLSQDKRSDSPQREIPTSSVAFLAVSLATQQAKSSKSGLLCLLAHIARIREGLTVSSGPSGTLRRLAGSCVQVCW